MRTPSSFSSPHWMKTQKPEATKALLKRSKTADCIDNILMDADKEITLLEVAEAIEAREPRKTLKDRF